ncbi:MAG: YjbQ family protein, partial [Gemmatimonadaceae bacterium]
MRTHTSYRTFKTAKRQEIIDITDDVEACRAAAAIDDGFVLVSAMHISASVFVNDHEPGHWADILEWLDTRIAPWDPAAYRHNSGTG